MPQLDKSPLLRKMKDLKKYLDDLGPYVSIGVEKYQRDHEKRYVIEAKEDAPLETYYSTFVKLGELKVVPKELSVRLASTAGLRNRIAHHYEDIEHRIVYHSAVRLLKDYRHYFRLIEKYLQAK